MAAPSGTVWGSIVNGTSSGRKGRLGIYVNVANTATQTTVTLQVWFWTIYSCKDSNNKPYFSYGPNVTSATGEYSSATINHTVSSGSGWSTSNQTMLFQHIDTYARGTSAVTHKAYAKLGSIDILNGAVYANTSYTIPALASYTVTYNANGGSGAPSARTKWHGTNLTLSSTKPTRTGYSFQGWALTKADADNSTWYYQPGGTCGRNENLTLYAVWRANTYTVAFNANGGSGAPADQTKTYGVSLTLSSTKPTRTNYNFKGWGTSASATTVAYAAGGSYTANAGATLYAIWELAYAKPRITNFVFSRCPSEQDASIDDQGTYAWVYFEWACDRSVTTVKIEWKLSSATIWANAKGISSSGSSGVVSTIVGSGGLSVDNTYDIRVTVADGSGDAYTSTETGTLEGTKFLIDLRSNGNGISFGKPAELNGYMDVGYKSRFRDSVVLDKSTVVYALNKDNKTRQVLNFNNETEFTVLGYGAYAAKDADGNSAPVGGTNIYGKEIVLYSRGDITTSAPLHLTRTTDASGTADNNPALTIGPTSGAHLEFDNNEIMAKASGTTTDTLYINKDGGNVRLNDNKIGDTYIRGCRMAVNKVLWSGAYYMNEGQTVPLDESPISAQANGIVLIWSEYSDGAAVNANFNAFFIPKYFVTAQNDRGVAMSLWTATANTFASKYVYVEDTVIKGYVNNAIDPWTTGCGITTSPKKFVLRYVIGV